MDSQLILSAAFDIAAAIVAILVALGMVRLGTLQYAIVAPADAEAVPILHVLGAGTGLVAGMALLLSVPHAGAFAPGILFERGAAWDLSLGDFLAAYALPRWVTLRSLLLSIGGEGSLLQVATARFAMVGLLAGPLLALRLWRGLARLRALAAFLLLVLWTALILHYALHLAAWTVAQLNFWTFAIALLLFQRWRYRTRLPAH